MNKYTKQLITRLEIEMEEYWEALSNSEMPREDLYFTCDELAELGLGGVFIPKMNGTLGWFSFEEMSF